MGAGIEKAKMKKRMQALSNTKKILLIALVGFISFAGTQTDTLFEITKNIEIFTDVYRTLQESYVDEPEPGSLIKTAIDAMLNKLDPYTVYYPESRIEEATFMQTGQYGGVGINTSRRDDKILITDVYKGFGADKAGLEIGDYIIAIEGQKVSGLSDDESGRMIKGQPGTTVNLEIERGHNGKIENITVTRENIKNKDVPYFGLIPNTNTGYIKLEGFTQTASAEVRDAFQSLKTQGMERLVFDLRGNGGGLLREAVNIVNFFVPKGSSVVETKGRMAEWKNQYTAMNDPLDLAIPIIVLIDEKSASASEIVAGSLQDLDRAVIIGKESFGKGLVQQTVDLAYNAKMKLTVAKYYTPSGRCVQRLDYSHRDASSGVVQAMADSSLKYFKTKNGRKVIEGRGIQPDITMDEKNQSPWIKEMTKKYVLFDFVTHQSVNRGSIDTTGNFHITDATWQLFESELAQKKIKFEFDELKELKTLKKELIRQQLAEEKDFVALEDKISTVQPGQLKQWKSELQYLIEVESVRRLKNDRWYYKQMMKNDPLVLKALETFGTQYSLILQPNK